MSAYFAGVDGGGTSTKAVVIDEFGTILGRGKSGPSNANDIGAKAAADAVLSAVSEAMKQASNITKDALLQGVFCGIGGGLNRGAELQAILKSELTEHLAVGSDAENLIFAGLGMSDGIVLISGTGSSCFAQAGGRVYQAGGWGWLFDGGCGFEIARTAIERVFEYHDGRAPGCQILHKCIFEALGGEPWELLSQIYGENPRKYIASAALAVFRAADLGSAEAELIIEKNADYLINLVSAAAKAAELGSGTKVILSGGVAGEPRIKNRLESLRGLGFLPETLTISPELGAALKAKALFGGGT
ncbi:MAG: N-acetylglucosamine kinase [Eubacteriales bacterium]|jgi:glucosamine kinase